MNSYPHQSLHVCSTYTHHGNLDDEILSLHAWVFMYWGCFMVHVYCSNSTCTSTMIIIVVTHSSYHILYVVRNAVTVLYKICFLYIYVYKLYIYWYIIMLYPISHIIYTEYIHNCTLQVCVCVCI